MSSSVSSDSSDDDSFGVDSWDDSFGMGSLDLRLFNGGLNDNVTSSVDVSSSVSSDSSDDDSFSVDSWDDSFGMGSLDLRSVFNFVDNVAFFSDMNSSSVMMYDSIFYWLSNNQMWGNNMLNCGSRNSWGVDDWGLN